jgi:hypothetical protein
MISVVIRGRVCVHTMFSREVIISSKLTVATSGQLVWPRQLRYLCMVCLDCYNMYLCVYLSYCRSYICIDGCYV